MTDMRSLQRKPRVGRKPQGKLSDGKAKPPLEPKSPSKLDQIEAMLRRENGASIEEMVEATGWQQHSVRGAMAGALKKRGSAITSEKIEGTRRYHAEAAA